MASLQRVDEMHEPPIVGQFYLVPTIFYRFGEDYRKGVTTWPPLQRHHPVMGTRHEDGEYLGFPHFHYHMDWRFAKQAVVRTAMARGSHWFGEQALFGIPLIRSGEPDHGPVTYRRMKCLRIPPINVQFSRPRSSGFLSGGQLLHRAFFGKPAAPGPHGWICPHRGTVLGSVPVNLDGTITCPLHGLKFCAKTGASIATHDMTAK